MCSFSHYTVGMCACNTKIIQAYITVDKNQMNQDKPLNFITKHIIYILVELK